VNEYVQIRSERIRRRVFPGLKTAVENEIMGLKQTIEIKSTINVGKKKKKKRPKLDFQYYNVLFFRRETLLGML